PLAQQWDTNDRADPRLRGVFIVILPVRLHIRELDCSPFEHDATGHSVGPDWPRPGSRSTGITSGSTPWRAASTSLAPSTRTTPLNVASQRREALFTSVSNTGCTSVGEREITRRISLVAVCCSSDSDSSRFLVASSLNRRTFSIAMTA